MPLVDDDELAWQRRRGLHLDRLGSDAGFPVVAVQYDTVVGYALVCVERGPDDTFPVAEPYAELYSLAVAPELRGRGIGTSQPHFVDRELARRSIADLKVAVLAGNTRAERIYERRGLRRAELVLYRFGGRGESTDRFTAPGAGAAEIPANAPAPLRCSGMAASRQPRGISPSDSGAERRSSIRPVGSRSGGM